MSDVFTWIACYDDGSSLMEIESDGTEHGFAEVDLDRLSAFVLNPMREGLPSPVVKIDRAGGQRPIFFRRRSIALDPETHGEANRSTITVLGWQKTVEGKNVKSFAALYEDGSVLISDRDEF